MQELLICYLFSEVRVSIISSVVLVLLFESNYSALELVFAWNYWNQISDFSLIESKQIPMFELASSHEWRSNLVHVCYHWKRRLMAFDELLDYPRRTWLVLLGFSFGFIGLYWVSSLNQLMIVPFWRPFLSENYQSRPLQGMHSSELWSYGYLSSFQLYCRWIWQHQVVP